MPPHLRRARTGLVATTAAALGLAVALPSGANAATASRVQVDAAPSWTAQATNTGAVASSALVKLTAVLSLRDFAGAQALATAVSDPKSAQYKDYVTPAAWRAAYAPTAAQVKSVSSWLTGQGFTIGEIPANGRYVTFTGTVAKAEAAFGTNVDSYLKGGQAVIANSKPVSVPAALSGLVAGIDGFDTSVRSAPTSTTGADTTPAATPAVAATSAVPSITPSEALPPPDLVFKNAGPCSTYYGAHPATGLPDPLKDALAYAVCGYNPGQLRGAYKLNETQAQGVDGSGVTVAVVDAYASPYIASDAKNYAKFNDSVHPFQTSKFQQLVPAGGYTNFADCGPSGWYGEETLDVEAVHAMAPGANILYVAGASCEDPDLSAAVNTVVDNDLADVVTNSYGDEGESPIDAGIIEDEETSLQAAAEGISLMFSSGDDGDEIAATGVRQADYEATDPFVTAVGGTSLDVTKGYGWGREIGWGTGKAILTNGAWAPLPPAFVYGGGGGPSHYFAQPLYQAGIVPDKVSESDGSATPMRTVPDVALDADPQTGMLIGQSQSFPDGSVQYSQYRIGGTSLASPLLAGLTAVYDEGLGFPLGFLNPVLYALNGSSAFHDVNDGTAVTAGVVRVDYKNGYDATGGLTTSLRTFNQTGTLWTVKGYDDVTGVGTPNGYANFINSLLSLLPASKHGASR